uniref:C2H2-type domain-containing protein n=1 Tax=Heterorhabditis bacteriophora TaxID=37862 RepID=A0A1I7XQX4_HETBA
MMFSNPLAVLHRQLLQQPFYQHLALCQLAVVHSQSGLSGFLPPLIYPLPTTTEKLTSPVVAMPTVINVPTLTSRVLPTIPAIMAKENGRKSNKDVKVTIKTESSPSGVINSALNAIPTPDATPSPSADVSCTSPSTSMAASLPKEDEDYELFVDVESVNCRPEGKDRRRAHIEFYRKIKSIRHREKMLYCALCDQRIPNNDNSIHAHVNHHAGAGGYWCKLCGCEQMDKYKIYEHMKKNHPKKIELFEDRRDMVRLCSVIQDCFPRTCSRSKKNVSKIDNFIKLVFRNLTIFIISCIYIILFPRKLEDKKLDSVKCEICDKMVVSTKESFTRHAQEHSTFRCKQCKYTSESIPKQMEHQKSLHSILDPRITVDFNVCGSVDAISRSLNRCFAHALQ